MNKMMKSRKYKELELRKSGRRKGKQPWRRDGVMKAMEHHDLGPYPPEANTPGTTQSQMTLQFHFQALCGPDSAGVQSSKANWITFPEFPHSCNLKTNLWIIWMNFFSPKQVWLSQPTCYIWHITWVSWDPVQFHEFALMLESSWKLFFLKKNTI